MNIKKKIHNIGTDCLSQVRGIVLFKVSTPVREEVGQTIWGQVAGPIYRQVCEEVQ